MGRRTGWGLLLLSLLATGGAAEARAGRLLRPAPANQGRGAHPPRLQRAFPGVIGSGPLRPLLPGSGRSYEDLLKSPAPAPEAVIRVAVFRVEYENDTAGDVTTGDGRFLLGPNDGSWPIDSPPHDSTYLHTHLEVLRRYYAAQSYGRLRIEWEIFPKSLSGGEYRLHDTADYLPEGRPGSWTLDDRVDGLVRLCRDALVLVDTADALVDFSAFDGYMVVHAGPDLQTDVNGDSPGDTPSFFLSFGDEDTVFVDRDAGDSVLVRGVTMIPEYTSQDGFLFGLNGVIAHEFGHQLGLPDLYDTERSWPAVGVWDLMDSGGMISIDAGDAYLGSVIPASLSAWCKLYLGWAEPEIVTSPRDLEIACSTLLEPPEGTPRVGLIPLNDREYFLLENRCGLAATGDYAAKLDTVNNIVLGPVTNDDAEAFTYDYDYALPGWGLLIWHINNRKLTEESIWYLNNVNVDYNDRAVEVEEADGIKDLGNPYSAYWDGSPNDPYFAGNATVFGPRTWPNSDLADAGKSGVTVRGIGAPGLVMELSVDVDRSLEGWPVPLLADSSAADGEGLALEGGAGPGVAAFWSAGDSTDRRSGVTLIVPAEGTARVRRADLPGPIEGPPLAGGVVDGRRGGEMYACAGGRALRIDPHSEPPVRDLGSLRSATVSAGPLFADVDGNGTDELVLADAESLSAYAVFEDSVSLFLRAPLPGSPSSNLAALGEGGGGERIAFLADGSLYIYSWFNDKRTARTAFPVEAEGAGAFLLLLDMDRDGAVEFLIVAREGVAYALAGDGTAVPGWPVDLGTAVTGAPFACDRNADGYPELAVPCGPRLVLLEKNGIRQEESPLAVPPYLRGERSLTGNGIASAPYEGSGVAPVVSDDGGRLWSWNGRETPREGWPISTGSENVAIVAGRCPEPERSAVALFALSRDGFVYACPLEGASEHGLYWSGPGGNPRADFAPRDTVLAEPDGPGEGPGRIVRAYCYPNPARDRVTVRYELRAAADVSVRLHDAAGGGALERAAAPGSEGENEVVLDAKGLASGVYSVRIEAGSESKFVKLAIVR